MSGILAYGVGPDPEKHGKKTRENTTVRRNDSMEFSDPVFEALLLTGWTSLWM